MSTKTIVLDDRVIGAGAPPYIIAELSGNHNGDIARAFALIEAAAEAGVDAVKFQTYTADTLTLDHDGPGFRIEGGPWDGRTLYDLYTEAATPWDWHSALFEKARTLGVTPFSSGFDSTAIDFLSTLNCPAYKIASFEIVDLALIEKVAATGKPLIVSTGLATREEIAEAVEAARRGGCDQLALLHCTSGYPTPPEDANLAALADLAERFETVVGLSDHSLGIAVPVAAVALGAAIVEKHVTLRRADGGPDAGFSLEPEELAALVEACRTASSAIGRAGDELAPSEQLNRAFRRSLFVVEDMKQGEAFTTTNVRSIRPAGGMAPKNLPSILGCRAARAIARGTPLDRTLVEATPETA